MTVEAWLLFCLTETVLCFTPGPAVLLVISLALSRGARSGFDASLGILAANSLYFLISATSLGAVLLASWQLFVAVKYAGAAYLIYLGARMLFSPSRSATKERSSRLSAADVQEGVAAKPDASRRGSFALGFLTQGANPKALVFFSAILPQFIDPQSAVAPQVAILGISSVLIELAVLAVYVIASHRARAWTRHPRFATPLQRAGGVLLIAAGARLAAVRRG
jgi:homoserine/homoserine lactone efflux protein